MKMINESDIKHARGYLLDNFKKTSFQVPNGVHANELLESIHQQMNLELKLNSFKYVLEFIVEDGIHNPTISFNYDEPIVIIDGSNLLRILEDVARMCNNILETHMLVSYNDKIIRDVIIFP